MELAPEVVIVTGSREWEDKNAIYETLKRHRFGTVLIHGGCRGADMIAAYCGAKLGFKLWELPYFENDQGEESRNSAMVELAGVLMRRGLKVYAYAFPLPGSRGTWKCYGLMKGAGLDPKVIR